MATAIIESLALNNLAVNYERLHFVAVFSTECLYVAVNVLNTFHRLEESAKFDKIESLDKNDSRLQLLKKLNFLNNYINASNNQIVGLKLRLNTS